MICNWGNQLVIALGEQVDNAISKGAPMVQDRNEIIDFLSSNKDELRQCFDVTSIGLFGNFARAQAREDSDVDIRNMDHRVCVIGLGYVGLPTALLLASRGLKVHGVDTDADVVERICRGAVGVEPGLTDLWRVASTSKRLTASTEPDCATVFIITVPTPLGPANTPDVSHVMTAVDGISPYVRAGALVCIESTCPVGTTEEVAARLPPGVHVAYCPERMLPGRIVEELVMNNRIVGGVTTSAIEQAVAFYRTFVTGEVVGTDARTAELVKLAENTYRDVNIAFANELSMLSHRFGVDIQRVIALANYHPRVSILSPGIGVGGHCVAVDPWFLISAAPDIAKMATVAREVNLAKTDWVVDRILAVVPPDSVIACFGLTYKPNVDDLRESPAVAIVCRLSTTLQVLAVDPYVPDTVEVPIALERANVVVGLVAHRIFRELPPEVLRNKIVLDFAGVFA